MHATISRHYFYCNFQKKFLVLCTCEHQSVSVAVRFLHNDRLQQNTTLTLSSWDATLYDTQSSELRLCSQHIKPLTPTVVIWVQLKYPVPDRVKLSFVVFDILTIRAERQSARMSKITNDGLTRSGTGCFIAVPIWLQWASKS